MRVCYLYINDDVGMLRVLFVYYACVCVLFFILRVRVCYTYIFGITTSIDTRLYYYFSCETILTVKRFLILHIYILCENYFNFFMFIYYVKMDFFSRVLFNFLYCIIYKKTTICSPCKARIRKSSCSRAVVSRRAPSHVGRRRHRPRC